MRSLFIALMVCSLWACNDPSKGATSPETRVGLALLADQPIDVREKYFRLSKQIADLLEEAAGKGNDAAAMALIEEFLSDNDLALEALYIQFEGWQKHTSDEELVAFITRLNEQPYTRRIRNLGPRFRARVRYDPNYEAQMDRLLGYMTIYRGPIMD
ncbi:MAG: hypothetical protein AAF206_10375 [Bacteroidota bacterium]